MTNPIRDPLFLAEEISMNARLGDRRSVYSRRACISSTLALHLDGRPAARSTFLLLHIRALTAEHAYALARRSFWVANPHGKNSVR